MKACYPLLLLLLVASLLHAQDSFTHEQPPIIFQSPYTNPTSPNYTGCVESSDFDAHVVTIGYDQYMLYLTWDMEEPEEGWIHWDVGTNYKSFGASAPYLVKYLKILISYYTS